MCSAKVIYESDLMQDFLCLHDTTTPATESSPLLKKAVPLPPDTVKVTVQLPDNTQKTYSIPENSRTPDLLDVSSSICVWYNNNLLLLLGCIE